MNPLEQVSMVYEFNEVNEFMGDDEVERALIKVTDILAKTSNRDSISGVNIAKHIVECQVLSAYFAINARYYMGIGKSEPDAAQKKNVYMTMKEAFMELSNALKYIEKAGR